ncbi:uncharacterized protein MYCFIDRAFT_216631 [Pseudocercospora fijiensis CIRAD86]|uniref:Uncharacterized protein n=1 Tax=Pseudocercospora fijiensis (strain CIRAD86) TaxID=383855 RepID=M2ZGY0_PSEFD|nr:uncharacterized protein MYCFIDRAFT_216631 [Pseudocercospora fijiensis CIRAD86]EME78394.1 hypothetical protein MYCFIDRAFT_216631 [Pseudocercospora fijiensis CIRAD86]
MQKAPSTMETSRTEDMFKDDRRGQEEPRTFGESLARFFGVMFCCMSSYDDEVDETHGSDRKLEISAPTNFRREEMDIPGLTEEQSKMYREKQRRDAERMWNHLQPLRSSPSGTFAERPADNYPTYEAFTQPRSAPKPGQPRRSPLHVDTSPNSTLAQSTSPTTANSRADSAFHQSRSNPRLTDRVKAHSRKFSDSWNYRKSAQGVDYHQPPYNAVSKYDDVEMARLMLNSESKTAVNSSTGSPVGEGKQSEDSFCTRVTDVVESTERVGVGMGYKI